MPPAADFHADIGVASLKRINILNIRHALKDFHADIGVASLKLYSPRRKPGRFGDFHADIGVASLKQEMVEDFSASAKVTSTPTSAWPH